MSNTKRKVAKRKEAEVGFPQPPQDQRAATQTTRGEFSSAAADLQSKMKEAAKEFADLEWSNRGWKYEPQYRDQPNDDLLRLERYLPYAHCTPEAVLFRLGNEWIRLTEENMAEAFINLGEERLGKERASKIIQYTPVGASEDAKWWLADLRRVAKKYGKVSWVLPKRKGGVEK